MHLKDFSLVYPDIQSSDVLKAIEIAIPAFAIEQAIANTKTEEERRRSLPAQLVVSLVIAMSLWSKDSMRDVLKNLIDGLSEAWVKILDTLLPERVSRNNPRVVKKPVSKFRSKKPKHRGSGQRVEAPKFHITNQSFSLN